MTTTEQRREYKREWARRRRENDPEYRRRIRENQLKSHNRHKEKRLASARLWKERNKEKHAEYRRAYYAANKERERANNLKWLAENGENFKETKRILDAKWREANADVLKAKRRDPEYRKRKNERERQRYHSDKTYRLLKILRASLTQAIRLHGNGCRKSASAARLVGCSLPELAAHLEAQFLPGMTWESDFHIDHIRPCRSFDLSNPEQVRACFHFTNLRPLWPIDNFRKSGKWEQPCPGFC